ncbi:MAG: FxsA family protein [Devosiaceae bacterium]|nr:FxsA family protein [Devosiaceae bacterium]
MGRILFFVFLAVPILEIGIFIAMGQAIGLWPTLAGVVVTALIGSYVIKIQGLSLIREIQQLMGAGVLPARQIGDGLMLAIAGALLLTPGYFTDLCGFLLLVPSIRNQIYSLLKSRMTVSAGFNDFTGSGTVDRDKDQNEDNVVDLDENNWR